MLENKTEMINCKENKMFLKQSVGICTLEISIDFEQITLREKLEVELLKFPAILNWQNIPVKAQCRKTTK